MAKASYIVNTKMSTGTHTFQDERSFTVDTVKPDFGCIEVVAKETEDLMTIFMKASGVLADPSKVTEFSIIARRLP